MMPQLANEVDFVRITPIISRHGGKEMAELGAGGGQGDLDVRHELEVGDAAAVGQLIGLCASKLQGEPQLLASVMTLLTSFINHDVSAVSLHDSGLLEDCARLAREEGFEDIDDVPLDRLIPALANLVNKSKASGESAVKALTDNSKRQDGLRKRIVRPHSQRDKLS